MWQLEVEESGRDRELSDLAAMMPESSDCATLRPTASPSLRH